MAKRVQIVKDRSDLANKLSKLEVGKSQAKIGDIREALKKLVTLEAIGYSYGHKSVFHMLRAEAIFAGKQLRNKRKALRKKALKAKRKK